MRLYVSHDLAIGQVLVIRGSFKLILLVILLKCLAGTPIYDVYSGPQSKVTPKMSHLQGLRLQFQFQMCLDEPRSWKCPGCITFFRLEVNLN